MRIPRCSSHVTEHSILFVGSALPPCRTALASASRSAISISNSFPAPYSISLTRCITQVTTGEIVLISAASITSKCVDGGGSFFPGTGSEVLVTLVSPRRVEKKGCSPRGYSKHHHLMEGICIFHCRQSIDHLILDRGERAHQHTRQP